jgi:large subunit ribosomal protein L7/L12
MFLPLFVFVFIFMLTNANILLLGLFKISFPFSAFLHPRDMKLQSIFLRDVNGIPLYFKPSMLWNVNNGRNIGRRTIRTMSYFSYTATILPLPMFCQTNYKIKSDHSRGKRHRYHFTSSFSVSYPPLVYRTDVLVLCGKSGPLRRSFHTSFPLFTTSKDLPPNVSTIEDSKAAESSINKDATPPPPPPPAAAESNDVEDTTPVSIEETTPSLHQISGENKEATTKVEDNAASSENDNSHDNNSSVNDDPNAVSYAFTPPPPLSEVSQQRVEELFKKILWLDMIEVHLLTQLVNENLGISWKETELRMMGGGGSVAGGAAKTGTTADSGDQAAVEEAKTIFDLKLVRFDAAVKLKVIKEIRSIAGLGLKEAKELVEAAPKVFQKQVKKEKAEELKAQLEKIGAEVELV